MSSVAGRGAETAPEGPEGIPTQLPAADFDAEHLSDNLEVRVKDGE